MGKTAYDVVLGRGVAAFKGLEFIYQYLVKMDADGYWKNCHAARYLNLSIQTRFILQKYLFLVQKNNRKSDSFSSSSIALSPIISVSRFLMNCDECA